MTWNRLWLCLCTLSLLGACDSIIKADPPGCENECDTLGARRCAGAAGTQACETGSDGCLAWSEVSACPDPDDSPCVEASCEGAGVCATSKPSGVSCDDGVECTDADTCSGGACAGLPNHASCEDGNFCNGVSTCAAAGCVDGAPPSAPDDPDPSDCWAPGACDEATDSFPDAPAALGTGCADGVECTIGDQCDASGTCAGTPNDGECDDGEFCNGAESCDAAAGECVGGAAQVVDDGVGCTVDSCNEATDAVEHTPSDEACDDGAFCTGVETCDAQTDCQPGTAPSTDDGVACTVDLCDEGANAVTHTPDHGACNNGDFCDGPEVCHPTQGCQAGAAPALDDDIHCTVDACDEALDEVTHTPTDALCDDGAFCNGDETCAPEAVGADSKGCAGGVAPAAPPDGDLTDCFAVGPCDDGVDGFPPVPVASGADCDDAIDCTTADACDAVGGCAGTPDDTLCDDTEPCTADACQAGGGCANLPVPGDVGCDDGEPCTIDDTCTEGSCSGTALVCDDSDACTTDSCAPAFGCRHAPTCTAACGCVSSCLPTSDGLACDDGDPATIGDLCLAGGCAGFVVTLLDGPGFGDADVEHLAASAGTLWALGEENADGADSSWIAPVERGGALVHLRGGRLPGTWTATSNRMAVGFSANTAMLRRGVRYDSPTPGGSSASAAAGTFAFDGGLDAALGAAVPDLGSIEDVWGATFADGSGEWYLVGRNNAFNAARIARCTHPPLTGPDPAWACESLGFTASNAALIPELIKRFFPQRVGGIASADSVEFVAAFGLYQEVSGAFKYNITQLEAPQGAGLDLFDWVGGFFSGVANGFVNALHGVALAPGKLWVAGTKGFLATIQDDLTWFWDSAAMPAQGGLFFRALAAADRITVAISERVQAAPAGGGVTYVQNLHVHRPDVAEGTSWVTVPLERVSAACVSAACPADPVKASSLHAAAALDGRLVLAGAGFDPQTGAVRARVAERALPGACSKTLLSADFDDGTLGPLTATITDVEVFWGPGPLDWTPPNQAGPFRGTAYYGNPVTHSYEGNGTANAGSLRTPLLQIPQGPETVLRFQLWQSVETHPDYDRLEVDVECKGPSCPGDPTTLAFHSKLDGVPMAGWHGVEIPLTPYAGNAVEIVLRFDTFDGQTNDFIGVFIDGLRVVVECPPDPCDSPAACADADPCTIDGCWLGQCQNVPACEPLPYGQDMDGAAVVHGEPWLGSVGLASGTWTLDDASDDFAGTYAWVKAENFEAADESFVLHLPRVDLTGAAAPSLTMTWGFAHGVLDNTEDARLRVRAVWVGGASAVEPLWATPPTGDGSPTSATIALTALLAYDPPVFALEVVAVAPTLSDLTWRVDELSITGE